MDEFSPDELVSAIRDAYYSKAGKYGSYSSQWGKVYRGRDPIFVFSDDIIFPTRYTNDEEQEFVENSSWEDLGIEPTPEESEEVFDPEDEVEELPEEPPEAPMPDEIPVDDEEEEEIEGPDDTLPTLELQERINRFLGSSL